MQRFTLIKQYSSVQLAHLYEHLFCNAAKSFLYQQGLFKYLDFNLYGTTYEQGGIVEIDVEIYTPYVRSAILSLDQLPVQLDNKSVHLALMQIIAEEGHFFSDETYDYEAILKELAELDRVNWQQIDDFKALDTNTIRRRNDPLCLSNTPYRSRKLVTTISLDADIAKEHRTLLGLFRHATELILPTVADQLSIQLGYYAEGDIFKSRTAKVDLLVAGTEEDTNLEEYLDTLQDTIKFQIEKEAFSRLLESLQNLSHANNNPITWNTTDILKKTGVMIGAKGWQQLATHENLALLWPHMSIEVKLGRQKLTAKLPPLS